MVLFPLLSRAKPQELNDAFDFLKQIKRVSQGDKPRGLNKLKNYLQQFGYLNYELFGNQTHAKDDDFDDLLEDAIKNYQLNFHIDPTETLDPQTVSTKMTPRCGVADIINGITRTRLGQKAHHHGPHSIHAVSHYTFFPGSS